MRVASVKPGSIWVSSSNVKVKVRTTSGQRVLYSYVNDNQGGQEQSMPLRIFLTYFERV